MMYRIFPNTQKFRRCLHKRQKLILINTDQHSTHIYPIPPNPMFTASQKQKSKSKIRPPRKTNSLVHDPSEAWKILKAAIQDIQNRKASKWTFEQLYRLAYNLVLSKHSQYLYNNVHDEIVNHLNNITRVQLEAVIIEKYRSRELNNGPLSKSDAAIILNTFKKLWDDHLISIWLISQVVMYMDRTFTKDNRLPLTYDVGLLAFQKCITSYQINELGKTIGDVIIETMLEYFNLNRHGEIIDKSLIKAIITIFDSLVNNEGDSYYVKNFEPELLIYSHRYYTNKVNELLGLQSGSMYINNVVDIISDEENRFTLFLPERSTVKLKDLMYKDLVLSNAESIIDLETDGIKKWIDDDNYSLLTKVYKLIAVMDSDKTLLRNSLRKTVLSLGKELREKSAVVEIKNDEPADDKRKKTKKSSKELNTQFAINFIQNFISLKEKFDRIIIHSFFSDLEIAREIESACTVFLNENSRIQEYLSLYIDDSIKRSLKNKSAGDAEKIFDDAIMVFRFIKDKDIFEKYYKNHLAKRLLNNKSLSTELELRMISKLKTEAGAAFTAKFEGMFKDMRTSQDLTQRYWMENSGTSLMDDLVRMNDGSKLDIEFSILTDNFWPMSANKGMDDVEYSPVLDIAKASFEKFYTNTYNGRNLSWAPNMCTMDLKLNLSDKTYQVNMPTLAAFIFLTCFNDEDMEDGTKSLTFTEIQEKTKIPVADLIRHLQSISIAPKTRILKKIPMSKEINPTDRFSLNMEFKNPQSKFKILAVSMSSKSKSSSDAKFDATSAASRVETAEEHAQTFESIQKSREFEVDAAIVRIMKARQSERYQVLVAEVIRLIGDVSKRFIPQPALVKSRIEELIDKEYLRRDEEDREVFWYVA